MNERFLNFNIERLHRKPDNLGRILSLKNENSNSKFSEKFEEFTKGNISKYPQLADLYTEWTSYITNFQDIVFGFGSDGILRDLFNILEYNSIQMLNHSYEMGKVYNQILSKKIITNDFTFDGKIFSLKEKIADLGGDILYLVSPHCPTGFQLSNEEIKKLSKHFKYIILDEAYTNPLSITWDFFNISNIIIVKSFSKLGGVPGLRIGYCLTSNKDVLNKLKIIRPLYELNTTAVEYLKWIIKHPSSIFNNVSELKLSYDVLKSRASFGLMCGNFALFQPFDRFFGKPYTIDNQKFVRVTLTDTNFVYSLLK